MRLLSIAFLMSLSQLILGCGSIVEETNRIATRNTGPSAGAAPLTPTVPVGNIIGTGVWARSTAANPVNSNFNAVAVDSTGNIYAGGSQYANGIYTYGGQNLSGAATASGNCSIVRYNPDGTTQWAIANSTGLNGCQILGMAVDNSGNVYAAGSLGATQTYTFNGVAKTGVVPNSNILLIKMNSSGAVQWVRTTSSGTGATQFNAVSVDSTGNIYAAGHQGQATTNTYDGASATSSFNSGNNALIVKYDTNGNGIWARSVTGATAASAFSAVTTDSAGNIYAAGSVSTTGTFTFSGNAVTGVSAANNAVVVKYSSAGTGLWARTTTTGTAASQFSGIAADSGGGIFAVGTQTGNTSLNYGPQSIAGAYASGTNSIAVKYDDAGNAVWARTVTSGTNASSFGAAAADSNGHLYAAGMQTGAVAYAYGAQNATGANAGTNASLVKFDSAGNTVWARSVSPAPGVSRHYGLAVLSTEFLYAVGQQTGSGAFTESSQIVSAAGAGSNARIVKYR